MWLGVSSYLCCIIYHIFLCVLCVCVYTYVEYHWEMSCTVPSSWPAQTLAPATIVSVGFTYRIFMDLPEKSDPFEAFSTIEYRPCPLGHLFALMTSEVKGA